MLDCIGKVAYKLELPSTAEIHNVFHVSQLKLCRVPAASTFHPLPLHQQAATCKSEPETILDRKMVKRGRMAAQKS